MRVVLDTNVVVSGLLRPDGVPGLVVDYLFSGAFRALYDDRILGEYREVLARPRLDIAREDAAEVLAYLEANGVAVRARPLSLALPDPDDLPFIEVAVAGNAAAVVTGNLAHFPAEVLPVPVWSPRVFLGVLEGE